MHLPNLNPKIIVPHHQLGSFKSHAEMLYKIISRMSQEPILSAEQSWEWFAQALGYSSHQDLDRQALNYRPPHNQNYMSMVSTEIIAEIAQRISSKMAKVTPACAEEALLLLRASCVKAITPAGLADIMSEIVDSSNKEYSNIINPIHQSIILNDFCHTQKLIFNVDVESLSENSKRELIAWCTKYGLNDSLSYLLGNGASAENALDYKGWNPPLAIAIENHQIDTQIILVKHGANINREHLNAYHRSMPFFAIERNAHSLLDYCIDRGLLNSNDEYLKFSILGGCLQTFASIYRISSEKSILMAMQHASKMTKPYHFAILYKQHRDLIAAVILDDCLPEKGTHPRNLNSLLSFFRLHPAIIANLSMLKVARCIIDCAAENKFISSGSAEKECTDDESRSLIEDQLIAEDSPFNEAIKQNSIVELLSAVSQFRQIEILEYLSEYEFTDSLQHIYGRICSGVFSFSLMRNLAMNPQLEHLNATTFASIYNITWRKQWVKYFIDKANNTVNFSNRRDYLNIAKMLAFKLGVQKYGDWRIKYAQII